jgi:hypothetical protein
MRILRSYTIETELVEKLKTEKINASELVNQLLTEYFNKKDNKNLSLEELQQKLALIKLDREYKSKMENIKNGKNN